MRIEQASSLVTPEMVRQAVPCGPDPKMHIDALRAFADAGFDEVYVHQIGGAPESFFDFYAEQVLPEVPA